MTRSMAAPASCTTSKHAECGAQVASSLRAHVFHIHAERGTGFARHNPLHRLRLHRIPITRSLRHCAQNVVGCAVP